MKQAIYWILILTCILSTGSFLLSILSMGLYHTSYYTFLASCISGGILYLIHNPDKPKKETDSGNNIDIPSKVKISSETSETLIQDVSDLINSRQVINLAGSYNSIIDEIKELPDELVLIKLRLITKHQLERARNYITKGKWLEAEACQLHIIIDGERLAPRSIQLGEKVKVQVAELIGVRPDQELVVISITSVNGAYRLETNEYEFDGFQARHFGTY